MHTATRSWSAIDAALTPDDRSNLMTVDRKIMHGT